MFTITDLLSSEVNNAMLAVPTQRIATGQTMFRTPAVRHMANTGVCYNFHYSIVTILTLLPDLSALHLHSAARFGIYRQALTQCIERWRATPQCRVWNEVSPRYLFESIEGSPYLPCLLFLSSVALSDDPPLMLDMAWTRCFEFGQAALQGTEMIGCKS